MKVCFNVYGDEIEVFGEGFRAVRIESVCFWQEKKYVCGEVEKTFSCSKMESINLSENAVFVSRRLKESR